MSKLERPRTHSPQGKLKKKKELHSIAWRCPALIGKNLKFSTPETGEISRQGSRKTSIAFLSKAQRLAKSRTLAQKEFFLLRKTVAAGNRLLHIKSKGREPLSGIFKGCVAKAAATRGRLWNERFMLEKPSNRTDRGFLSHMDRLRLFQALSNQPLPFLDIHRRFGITKQTLYRFVKRGFVEENWGQEDIGVRFKLTNSGRSYLKQLKTASRLDPKKQKSIFIRLRHKAYW